MAESTRQLSDDLARRLNLPAATAAELRRIATLEDRTVPSVIRRAVHFYIDNKRKGNI